MQDDPLKPGYNFDAHLVAGLTPIIEGDELDFTIDRPNGMKGYIINLTSKGEGTLFAGDQAINVGPGDLVLFPPTAAHYYHREADSVCWFHRWVYFRPRAFWHDWLNWQEEQHGVYITRGLDQTTVHHLERLFIDIEYTAKSDEPYRSDLSINLLEQLLIRCKSLQPDVVSKPLDPRVIEAMNYMTQNLNQDFTMEMVASHICLSPSRLGHLFREEMSMTITQWRDDQRISRAKQLLVTTNYSVNQIGRIVGYTDPLYFSRVFKRKSGVSPKRYREQIT
ncbi:arabinose operon transcriptional regulator AraC [Vibrio spartinae]|uniref:Arabinose operon regulatory protein n=1 Tax=Vibrio spartinae TaxID=1918945 RepID=A0A1N6MA48_9VIBR|nr:arabinose operon transcriptional regulator AraC [Vibrio spartinae]QMV15927.1 Arabinose operon regulatory protein [Vibrio spartinae]SIO96236.1 Arabinose operon regulatory protein [Vibrio spartinae]